MKERRGFTLIELLVVVAIIGLLSTMAVVALNDARIKARDAKRLGDVKQLTNALELFYAGQNAYPAQDVVLGDAGARVLDATGFQDAPTAGEQVFLGVVPRDPQHIAPDRVYRYSCGAPCGSYAITFRLERPVGDHRDGNGDLAIVCVASPDGTTCN